MKTKTTLQWEKVPSVRTGGKPYFWYTKDSKDRRWHVLWNRMFQCWQVTRDEIHQQFVKAPQSGRRFAESKS